MRSGFAFARFVLIEVHQTAVFENFVKEVEVEMEGRRQIVRLALWDTAGQEDFSRLRTLSYPDTHCMSRPVYVERD